VIGSLELFERNIKVEIPKKWRVFELKLIFAAIFAIMIFISGRSSKDKNGLS